MLSILPKKDGVNINTIQPLDVDDTHYTMVHWIRLPNQDERQLRRELQFHRLITQLKIPTHKLKIQDFKELERIKRYHSPSVFADLYMCEFARKWTEYIQFEDVSLDQKNCDVIIMITRMD